MQAYGGFCIIWSFTLLSDGLNIYTDLKRKRDYIGLNIYKKNFLENDPYSPIKPNTPEYGTHGSSWIPTGSEQDSS